MSCAAKFVASINARRFFFFTAFADLLDDDEAPKAGAQGCLRKPEDTARLGEIARDLIERTFDAPEAAE